MAMTRHDISPRAKASARRLRKEMTVAEERLWHELRARRLFGAVFRRQVPIGPFVADFACHEVRLVVEVDGDSHDLPGAAERDQRRTAFLNASGYRVVRFDDGEILANLEGVLVEIGRHLPWFTTDLAVDPPLPVPPPPGGRGRRRRTDGAVTGQAAGDGRSGLNAEPGVPSPLEGEGQGEGVTRPADDAAPKRTDGAKHAAQAAEDPDR